MFEKKDLVVVADNKLKKEFNYVFGKCNLSFNLRVDVKSELKEYAELLKYALNEVEEELEKIDKNER